MEGMTIMIMRPIGLIGEFARRWRTCVGAPSGEADAHVRAVMPQAPNLIKVFLIEGPEVLGKGDEKDEKQCAPTRL